LKTVLDELFDDSNRRLIYNGYVDDPRNTDTGVDGDYGVPLPMPRQAYIR